MRLCACFARRLAAAAALWLMAAGAAAAQQPPLIADLSKHVVAITTGFAGTDVLLFGAVDEAGEVVVVVRGPQRSHTVRRKQRVAGVWVNSGEAVIQNAPTYYAVAASQPLEQIVAPEVRTAYQIGVDRLALRVRTGDRGTESAEYFQALIRLKQDRLLYPRQIGTVSFLARQLFRTDLHFPANVPVGTYSVEVYLVRDGEVVGVDTTPLVVSKVGLGADVYDFAHQRSALYGIIAILLAAGAGWLAAAAFRKG